MESFAYDSRDPAFWSGLLYTLDMVAKHVPNSLLEIIKKDLTTALDVPPDRPDTWRKARMTGRPPYYP